MRHEPKVRLPWTHRDRTLCPHLDALARPRHRSLVALARAVRWRHLHQSSLHGLAGLIWVATILAVEQPLVLSGLGCHRRSLFLDRAAGGVSVGQRPSLAAAQRNRGDRRL